MKRLLLLATITLLAFAKRLSKDVIPSHQKFHLAFDIDKWRYSGTTEIRIKVHRTISSFWLHAAKNVNVTKVVLNNDKKKAVEVTKFVPDYKLSSLTVYPKEDLEDGNYIVTLWFNGKVSTSLQGMIKTGWLDTKGKKHPQVTTHFEPDKARQAFPCFDEPAMKVMIKLIVDHPKGYQCNSAAPLETRKDISNTTTRSVFEETVPISIYLLAINIHDMSEVKEESLTGIPITVLTPPHKKYAAKITLMWAKKALDFFEKFLDTKYPFKKLDLMGIYDFNAGGMEHVGMIHLMYDCGYPSTRYLSTYMFLYCRTVVVHEVSHMWFGDLVSVKWWDDLWLKEGFARFITSYAMDRLKTDQTPGYHDFHLVDNGLISGIESDKYTFTKPVRQVLKNSYGAAAMFNSLSYSKAAWIIRSVVALIGEDDFEVGIRKYFTKFKFGSANFDDFAACFGNISPQLSVKNYMKNWLNQAGFPEVYSESFGNSLKIKQMRYTVSKNFVTDQTWYVPINYKVADTPSSTYTLWRSRYKFLSYDWDRGFKVSNMLTPLTSKWESWFIIDSKSLTFGIHRYDNDNYKRLAKGLIQDHSILTDTQRLVHVTNLDLLTNQNRVDPITVLETSLYIKKERNMHIISKWLILLLSLRSTMDNRNHRFKFNHYLKTLFIDHVNRIISKPFSRTTLWDDKANYSWLLILGMRWRVPIARKKIRRLYRHFKAGQHINPNFLSYILRLYLNNSDHWIKVFKKLDTYPKSLQEIKKIMRALCRTSIVKHQYYMLKYSISSLNIPRSEIKTVLCYIAYKNASMAWKFFKKHYKFYFRLYGEAQFSMNKLLLCLVSSLYTKSEYNDVIAFFKTHSSGTGESGLKRGLKQLSLNFAPKKKKKKKEQEDDLVTIKIKKLNFGKRFTQWWNAITATEIRNTDDAYESFSSNNRFVRK